MTKKEMDELYSLAFGALAAFGALLLCWFVNLLLQGWDRWHTPAHWVGLIGIFCAAWGWFWEGLLDLQRPHLYMPEDDNGDES